MGLKNVIFNLNPKYFVQQDYFGMEGVDNLTPKGPKYIFAKNCEKLQIFGVV